MKRTFIYSEVFADGLGFVLGEDNIVLSRQAKETNPSLHTMSASRAIANRRELHRLSPRLLLEMRDRPERLAALADETIDGKTLSVISYKADDAEWIVLFADDGLPARIRTVDADGVWGDCNYDLILSDWREVDGVKFASTSLSRSMAMRCSTSPLRTSSSIPCSASTCSGFRRSSPRRPQSKRRPSRSMSQWILRRANGDRSSILTSLLSIPRSCRAISGRR